MTNNFEPEPGDKIEGVKAPIGSVICYSQAGQYWEIIDTFGNTYLIENTIFDPGPVKLRLLPEQEERCVS